jgi:hypothetical protein
MGPGRIAGGEGVDDATPPFWCCLWGFSGRRRKLIFRNQKPKNGDWKSNKVEGADTNCANYANSIRLGFGILNQPVGLAFNESGSLAQKNAGLNPFKITALLAQLPPCERGE